MDLHITELVQSSINHGETGKGLPVSRSIYNARMKECLMCAEYTSLTGACAQCGGCTADVRNVQSSMECPLGKWHKWIARVVYHDPKDEKRLPSFMVMVANAGGALARAASEIVQGRAIVRTLEEKERIHSICKMCPTKKYRASDDRCSECGCKEGWKSWASQEFCPDGHW